MYPLLIVRPTDMICISRHVQKLCSDLQAASCIQHLSLHFMDNEYAEWDHDGLEWMLLSPDYSSDRLLFDIPQILDPFKLLKT